MTRNSIILDPHWRRMDELFSPATQKQLSETYDIVWGQDAAIPQDTLDAALPRAEVLISANPVVTAATLARAPHLRCVIEVSGAFPDTIDYNACAGAGVEVLSCAPGFRQSVAEMGLGMAIAGARGLMTQHEAFRTGQENWLDDCSETDFSLMGAEIGFVGFGQIAQEMTRLLAPFSANISAFDPWVGDDVARAHGVTLVSFEDLMDRSRCLFVTAVPTTQNKGMIDATALARLGAGALVVLISRAHLVDFDALLTAAEDGRIRAAIDVFPSEPVDAGHRVRRLPNVILSPHRAAAVAGGRRLIGDMILADLGALFAGRNERMLTRANPEHIAALAGVGDADKVAAMADKRS